jgi:hypothetical protein
LFLVLVIVLHNRTAMILVVHLNRRIFRSNGNNR